jgi:CubicO group peptidase (beta-lactamase class C family)
MRPIDTLRFAASHPLTFPPGSQWRYSNTNYMALGLVIEKSTGRPYRQELEQRILEPLGLESTELPNIRLLPDLDDEGENPNISWAAGAMISNAYDLSRFFAALLSGRILLRGFPRRDEGDRRRRPGSERGRAWHLLKRAAVRTLLGSRRRHPRLRDDRQGQ